MIKLKRVIFSDPPFRKLRNIDLQISERITIVAGHNGIGKSTILGLIANCSGVKTSKYKSYFDLNYDANFDELFYLSKKNDLIEDKKLKPYVNIKYEFNGVNTLTKRCSVSAQTGDRLRVIPRTEELELGAQLGVGGSAKIPLPTIYLGMSRMSPIGEYQPGDVEKNESVKLDLSDAEYLSDCFTKVVACDIPNRQKVVNHRFKQSKKRSKVPEFTFDTLAISLGQDSLSSILTALASFKKIKREMMESGEEYQGGILVIDEIEAGLHPRAQINLLSLLKKEAKSLSLQIIATTHSLTVIKEVSLIQDLSPSPIDNVIYLINSKNPVLLEASSYPKIKNDMLLNQVLHGGDELPLIKIYFEDNEAIYFFEGLIRSRNIDVGEYFQVRFEKIRSKLGSESLLQLSQADNYFKDVIVLFDNDITSSARNRELVKDNENFIVLPASEELPDNATSTLRSPEAIIFNHLEYLLENFEIYRDTFWYQSQSTGTSTDAVDELIVKPFKAGAYNRDLNKKLFKDFEGYLAKVDIIQYWAEKNTNAVDGFFKELKTAVDFVLKRRFGRYK